MKRGPGRSHNLVYLLYWRGPFGGPLVPYETLGRLVLAAAWAEAFDYPIAAPNARKTRIFLKQFGLTPGYLSRT